MDDLIRFPRISRNLRIQPDQRRRDKSLEQHLIRASRKLAAGHERYIGRRDQIAHEVADRVRLVELRHQLPPKMLERIDERSAPSASASERITDSARVKCSICPSMFA